MDNSSTNKKVIVSLAVDSKDAIKRIVEAKNEIDNLKQANKELEQQGKKNTAEYVSNQEAIKSLNAVIRANSKEVQSQIDQYKNEAGSVSQLRAQLKDLTAQYNSLSEADRSSQAGQQLLETLKNTNDKLIEAETAWGNYTRLVGTYEKAIGSISPTAGKAASVFNQLSAGTGKLTVALKAAGTGVKTLGVQMLKLLANPFVAAFTAIVAVVAKLSNEFKKNDAAMTALQSLFAAFKPVLDVINKGFQVLVGVVTKGIEGISKLVQGVMGLIPGLKDYSKAEEDVVRSTDALEDADREYAENHAKREQQISELTNKSVQKDKYSYAERKKFVDEAIELEKADLAEKKKNAKERLRIAEQEAALSMGATKLTKEVYESLGDDIKNNLTELRVALTEAETEYNEGTRRLQSKRSSFVESEKKEQEELRKQRAQIRKERLDKERELLSELETATLDAMDESWEKQKLQLQKQYRDEIDTLKRRLKEETNLTKTAREAINQLIELKQKQLNEKLILANAKYWGEIRANVQNTMKNAFEFNATTLSDESLKKFFNTTQNTINTIYEQSEQIRKNLSTAFNQTLEEIANTNTEVNEYLKTHKISIDDYIDMPMGMITDKDRGRLSNIVNEYNKTFTAAQLNIQDVISKNMQSYTSILKDTITDAILSGALDAYAKLARSNPEVKIATEIDTENLTASFVKTAADIDEWIATAERDYATLLSDNIKPIAGVNYEQIKKEQRDYLDTLYEIKKLIDSIPFTNEKDLQLQKEMNDANDGTIEGEGKVSQLKIEQLSLEKERLQTQLDYIEAIKDEVALREQEYNTTNREASVTLANLNREISELDNKLANETDETVRKTLEAQRAKISTEIEAVVRETQNARKELVSTGFTSSQELEQAAKSVKDSIEEINKEMARESQNVIKTETVKWTNVVGAVGSAVDSIAGSMAGLFQQLAADDEKYSDYATGMAMLQILVSTAVSIAAAIEGATQSGAATGPGAFVATPAFIAEMVGIVMSALASATSTLLQAKQSKPSTPKFATGGLINRGQDGVDKVPIMATKGEYVIRKKKVDELGVDFLDMLNFGNLRPDVMKTHYAQGGLVNAPSNSTLNDVMRQQDMVDVMREVMSEIQPVVSVKEITRAQSRVRVKQA